MTLTNSCFDFVDMLIYFCNSLTAQNLTFLKENMKEENFLERIISQIISPSFPSTTRPLVLLFFEKNEPMCRGKCCLVQSQLNHS